MNTLQFSKKRKQPMAEINVVPYIDVMLVLLVIFMVTAPLLSQGVNVHLPQAQAKSLTQKSEPLIISVNKMGEYFLNVHTEPNVPINAKELVTEVSLAIQKASAKHESQDVYVKGDVAVDYGKVVQAMVLLQKAGAEQVGLITTPPNS